MLNKSPITQDRGFLMNKVEGVPFDVVSMADPENQKRYKENVDKFMETVPKHFHQSLFQANLLHTQNKINEAIDMYRKMSIEAPNSAFILFCLGTAYCNIGSNADGIQVLMRSVELMPENSEAWNNLGTAFKAEHQDIAASECFERSIEIMPDCGGTWANLAGCYVNNGMPERVIEYSEKALSFPEGQMSPQAHNHMGLGLLEAGRYTEAWPHYEWRTRLPDWAGNERDYSGLKRFDGTPIGPTGKLWICGEQGVGDEILFAQCIRDGIKRGHYREDQLVIEFNWQVCPAFQRTFPEAKVVDDFREIRWKEPSITHYIESGSLNLFYRSKAEDFDGSPYVRLDPSRVAYWRKRLETLGSGPYVGLTWNGGVKKTSAHLRAIPVELLKPLMKRKATFVSVQYGPHAIEATSVGLPHWTEQAYDLDERYHLIGALDLMITVCQTGFHMAGSIGKEVWCLTPSRPAWRYSGKGETSVWYDSATLIRQRGDDWPGLIHRAGIRLDKWIKEKGNEVPEKNPGKEAGR